jgi:hypothetical protein
VGVAIELPGAPLSTVAALAGTVPVNLPASTPASATAAVNTAVVVTVNGVAGQAVRITAISFSLFRRRRLAGRVSVVVNAVTILQLDIGAAAEFAVPLPDGGIECQVGQSAVVTLAAAGAAVAGKLNVASFYGA